MLGKVTLAQRDLAATAHAVAPAQAVDIDAQAPGGLQHRRSDGKVAALTRRGKDEAGGGDCILSHVRFLAGCAGMHRPVCGLQIA